MDAWRIDLILGIKLACNENSFDGVLKSGMVLCVETYVGRYTGGPGVKLEEQVLITANGYELLTRYPFESDCIGVPLP